MGNKMDALMDELNKSVKEEEVTKGLGHFNYAKIPFTSPRLNYITYGGVPKNKLIEFFGDEGGGKTTTALDVVANFQLAELQRAEQDDKYEERSVLYADIENRFNEDWAITNGVNMDKLYMYQPKGKSAEQIFNFITKAVKTGDICLVVIDSIAAIMSDGELDEKKDYTDKFYGGIAAPLTRFSKDMAGLASKYCCTCIGINQEREDMNSTWGGKRTPGGKAWKYMCSLRMNFRRGSFLDAKGKELNNSAETPAGCKIMVSIEKTTSGRPNRRKGHYTLNFTDGIDYLTDLIQVAIEYELIDQAGSWYTIIDCDKKFHGENEVRTYLSENADELKHLEELVDEKMSD